MANGEVSPAWVRVAHRFPAGSASSSSMHCGSGSVMKFMMLFAKKSATIVITTTASTEIASRLRSSRRCSVRGMRPSGSFAFFRAALGTPASSSVKAAGTAPATGCQCWYGVTVSPGWCSGARPPAGRC